MREYLICFIAAVAVCASAPGLSAQDVGALAGWAGLISTPPGGLPPVLVLRSATGAPLGTLFQLRYGHWRFNERGPATNTLGVGALFANGTSRTALELGVSKADCSDCRSVIGGVDMTIPLTALETSPRDATAGVFSIAINPAAGFAKPVGEGVQGEGYSLSLSGSVPFSVTFKSGEHVRVAPFLSPGAGVGLLNTGNSSESGFRWMLGGGVAMADLTPGLQITLSFRRVFIDEGPTVFGLGLIFGR